MPKESEPAPSRRLPRLYAPERDPDPQSRRMHILRGIISACGMLRKRYKRSVEARNRAGDALCRLDSPANRDKYESAKGIVDEYRASNREMLKHLNELLPETFKELRESVVVNEEIEDWERAEGEWVAVESDARAALVAQPAKPAAAVTAGKGKPVHSDDFTSVVWHGKSHSFTKTQARAVRILWENWERGTPTVGQETLGEIVSGGDCFRLRNIFRIVDPKAKGRKKVSLIQHPAWGTMIVPCGKGLFKLSEDNR